MSRGWKPDFGPWYIGKLTRKNGTVEFLEAVNGGPFRTVNGSITSLKPYLDNAKSLEIIQLNLGPRIGYVGEDL